MKRKKILAAVLCMSLAASNLASLTGFAEEEAEVPAEDSAEAAAEEETVQEVPAQRPDYNALDYVELGDYIGLKVTVSEPSVTDEDVLAEADARIRASSAMDSVDTVEEGDEVNIDYVGTLDGEEFEGGSSEDFTLEIGSGTFIEGFEDGLIGAHPGDIVELHLTFPEDYYYDDLAGQDVLFTVTVNEILRVPSLTDEVVSEVTGGAYTDVQSWLDDLRGTLEEDEDTDYDYEVQEALLRKLAAKSEITGYPQDLLDYTVAQSKAYYEELAEMYSMTYEEFLEAFGYKEDEFEEALREAAEESLQEELLLMAVADTEGITLSDEEYQTGAEKYAAYYGFDSTEEFEQAYEEAYGEKMLRISLLMDKVFDFLQENAVIRVRETEAETEAEIAQEEAAQEEAAQEEPAETAAEAAQEEPAETAAEAAREEPAETAAEAAEAEPAE